MTTPTHETLAGVTADGTGAITIHGITYHDGSVSNTQPFYSQIPVSDITYLANFLIGLPASSGWADPYPPAHAWISGDYSQDNRVYIVGSAIDVLSWVGGGHGNGLIPPSPYGGVQSPSTGVVKGAVGAVNTIGSTLDFFQHLWDKLTSQQFWLTVVELVIGVSLLGIGVAHVTGSHNPVSQLVGAKI